MSTPFKDPEDLIDFLVHKGNGVIGLSQLALENIPTQFIQPPEERLTKTQVVLDQSIPVVDVSNWDDPKVAAQICEAAAELGFFQIINHGISLEVLGNVKEAAHKFFALPVEERRKFIKGNSETSRVELKTSFRPLAGNVLEWKDYLLHTYVEADEETQHWPSVSKDQVLEYMKCVIPVVKKLLNLLLEGLKNGAGTDEVTKSKLMGSLIVDLMHYPKCPNPDIVAGAGRHSDISSITVLLQDEVGGLYVRGKGETWIHVAPTTGALVINVGDVLQIMSNDRYKSIEHRVIPNANKDRASVPVFVNPAPDAVIGPLQNLLGDGEQPIYKSMAFSDYYKYFFSKAHDGKQTIEFAKVRSLYDCIHI